MTMTKIRGRGATPVRPGILIKDVLSGTKPLIIEAIRGQEQEITVNEAAIVDLHRTYKALIERENALRPRERQLRPMVYSSFVKFTTFARLLGLIEVVRDEPMVSPPPRGVLYRLDKPDGVTVVESTRRIVKLTADGVEDGVAWDNLCRAWREGWTIPTRVGEPIKKEAPERAAMPEAAPPEPPVFKPRPRAVEWSPMKITGKPTPMKLKILYRHLQILEVAGLEVEDVKKEVTRIAMMIGDWEIELEDEIDEAQRRAKPRVDIISSKAKLLIDISYIREMLYGGDIRKAIERLGTIVKVS